MKKFLTIVGNRPQLIKLDKDFPSILLYTGQHYDKTLKDVFFKGLKIPKPKYNLEETELGPMIEKITDVLEKERPDYVIVYGDTRSTYAGALSAYYMNIPIIHIEAGCRSGNDIQIEERIRKFVDSISYIHLAPSKSSADRLSDSGHVWVANVGATQIDAMWEIFPTKRPKDAYKYHVLTIHRPENTDNVNNLKSIFEGLEGNETIEFYIHPRTEKIIKDNNITIPKNISVKKSIGYKEMVNRIAFAKKIITDSGGLQVEAFYLRRPCITLRNETEWHETVDLGWNKLVGASSEKIKLALKEKGIGQGNNHVIYGNGDANKKIRAILKGL